MSQTRQTPTERDVERFVDRNTTPTAKWCPGEEVVWVLSWYRGADTDTVHDALERAVSEGRLVSDGGRYTVPELL